MVVHTCPGSEGDTECPDTVDFVVHENTRAHLARTSCERVTNCEGFQGENARCLPQTTFADTLTLGAGPDRIDLYYFGRGHTDGDIFVVFSAARTVTAASTTTSSTRRRRHRPRDARSTA